MFDAAIHQRLTSDFLRLQSLITTKCDIYLIDLLHDYGNKFSNSLLEYNPSKLPKPNSNSSTLEREKYIRKKYIEKFFLRPYQFNLTYTQSQLDKMLYENVETSDYKKTLHLIMLGANVNYMEKMFAVADHAKRHQQIKQMKIILANGGSYFSFKCVNSSFTVLLFSFLLTSWGRHVCAWALIQPVIDFSTLFSARHRSIIFILSPLISFVADFRKILFSLEALIKE